ncbi:T9SS type A sorting domain-containing protein [Polaribacter sp. Q13]|uniref:T9SS type A sorting domain-containing protein n=1 Tax=Polaribacter sp. Q13 TaxID=2806551 RepID=UPI00193C76F2|nr:T9SS type A sorting domain-containing protein [Polaribacter sp. Q13]QVY66616.1 T9SS type A sorting domain-containing protein [Polaribacter sp. Q13]
MKKKLFLTLCLCLIGAFNLSATDYYVKADGSNSNDGLTAATPFLTIGKAHNTASDGDTIYIVGTVVSDENKSLNKSLSFVGTSSGTIIADNTDATTLKRGFFGLFAAKDITFTDLTFSGVTGRTAPGGVINANNLNVGNVTFTNCAFTNNTVAGNAKNGGAINFVGSTSGNTLTVTNCTFTSNSSDNGGGAIYVAGNQNLNLTNSTFITNSSIGAGGGGAVAVLNSGTSIISGCLFDGNSTTATNGHGGALNYNSNSAASLLTLTNSTFVNNTTLNRGGAIIFNGADGNANLTNVTVYNNSTTGVVNNGGGIRTQGAATKILNYTNCLFYGNTATGGAVSNIAGNSSNTSTFTNSLTDAGNIFDTEVASNRSADLTNSNLSFVTPNVTFTAPATLTDATPIDFGSDMSDVGAWDSKINLFNQGADAFWGNPANWSNGALPTATDNVSILSNNGNVNIKADVAAVVNNLVVTAPGTLTIKKGGSLIVSGSSTGLVNYKRQVQDAGADAAKGWYLVSAPVAAVTYDDTFAGMASGTGNNRGLATYDTANDNWEYLQAGGSGTFMPGQGYSLKVVNGGAKAEFGFLGTINTDDAGVNIPVAATGNRLNLLGNPYTSYISSATVLDNAALESTQIWVFNRSVGTNGEYVPKTYDSNFTLAPGQGFFAQAVVSATGDINFAESNQIGIGENGTTDTFQKTAKTEVKLQISVDGYYNYAEVYYSNNATNGFDAGYEGLMFPKSNDSFSIYTELLSNNKGEKYKIQSLSNSDLESKVIPVGVKAAANKEITFSAESLNLPSGLNVFLEDRIAKTFTRLDEANSTYKVTLTEALDGVGRFYVHTTAQQALSVDNFNTENISVYQANASTLRVVGLEQGNATISLYNVLGKQVLNNSFTTNGVKDISVPKLAKGLYIVQIKSATGKLNKKIILE